MKWTCVSLLAVLLMSPNSIPSGIMATGTIVVIAQTTRNVIVAADSRSGTSTGSTVEGTDDSFCKIVALPGKTVFTAAGILGNRARDWTAASEMRAVIEHRSVGTLVEDAQGDALLQLWAEAIMKRIAEFPPIQIAAYADANEGKLITGILAGLGREGTVWLHATILNYAKDGTLSYQSYRMTSADPPTAYYGLGKTDIFNEFERDKISARAINECKSWEDLCLNGRTFDQYKARRLVELTIQYHIPREDVGGLVDEIELNASDGQHWIQVKPQCR
jgi:hypothetical protein